VILLPLHVVGGLIGIVSGFAALYAAKGSRLHQKSGMVFVYAMLLTAATAAVLSAYYSQRFNLMQAALTVYLVVTALRTARRRIQQPDWLDAGAMIGALMVALYDVRFGFEAAGTPRGTIDGSPAAIAFIFGGVALVAAVGDARMMLTRRLEGPSRIARHLWRMCFAAFVASGSFFLGQAQVIPEPIRIYPLLAFLALLPLGIMVYWLRRVRVRLPHHLSLPGR
jgi:hypothetical protein